ncbi:PQQ-dependent sugar dehydrogenase [Streptomyces mirabilis]|uniref:PQQ-dependent sugar dehydrogenase n=1 Tax=Streptomyces mirabilis TaxID=68239 RepID=UPI00224D88B3|nr:PQQ-dependent sugar dehydrogenase [Streptomyces mirabilis]MCX5356259.1 PQQ-dependent sugar dehydrogenase [Streptomyces mirabilis]
MLAGCTSGGAEDTAPSAGTDDAGSGSSRVRVLRTVTQDLNTPWGVAALPDGDLLVSSRDDGTITRVDADSGRKTEAGTVQGARDLPGEGGLLGLAVSPAFASDRLVYAYLTTTSDNRIVRMRYDTSRPRGEQLGSPETVLEGIPTGTYHNGGRIAFGPDGTLYVGTGETWDKPIAQDRDSLGGKILRMTPEGRPARGNPEPDSLVYSSGHRNPQGLAFDDDGRLWASEFGQDTWDELNLIRPGRNYGWPEVEGTSDRAGFTDPVAQWTPAEASPSGIAYADDAIWMASLRGERLWRIPLDGARVAGKPSAALEGSYGRLRTVVAAGGDRLWLVTSNTDGKGSPKDSDDRILLLRVS